MFNNASNEVRDPFNFAKYIILCRKRFHVSATYALDPDSPVNCALNVCRFSNAYTFGSCKPNDCATSYTWSIDKSSNGFGFVE